MQSNITTGFHARRIRMPMATLGVLIGFWLCCWTATALAHGSGLSFKGSEGGIIRVILVTPKPPYILYAATSRAGVFKSTDRGNHWAPVNHGLTHTDILALALDPGAPRTLYAGTRTGVFKSDDGGDSWRASGTGLAREQVKVLALARHSPGIVYAGTYHGLWQSTDAGSTWTPLPHQPQDPDINALLVGSDPAQTLYVGTAQGLYRSRDAGATWTLLSRGLTIPSIVTLTPDPHRANVLYAGTGDGAYKSEDAGDSWHSITFKQTNLPVTAVLVDPRHPDTLYVGTSFVGGLFKTEDGGKTWQRIRGEDFTPSITVLAFLPDEANGLLAGTSFHASIFVSHDAGMSWKDTAGMVALPNLRSITGSDDGAFLFLAGQSDVYRFQTPQGPWQRLADASVGALSRVVYQGGSTPALWACGTQGVAVGRRTAGGWSFARVAQLGNKCADLAVIAPPGKVLVATASAVWVGPGQWRQVHRPEKREPIQRIVAAPRSAAWYVLTQHTAWQSTDQGQSWRRIAAGDINNLTDIVAVGSGTPTEWLAGDAEVAYRSTDGRWTNAGQGMFPPGIATLVAAPDGKTLYAASLTQGRVFRHDAAQDSWQSSDIEDGMLEITDLWLDPVRKDVLYAATHDSGLMRSDDAGVHWQAVNDGLPAARAVPAQDAAGAK